MYDRNENSVLFSLANLQRLAMAPMSNTPLRSVAPASPAQSSQPIETRPIPFPMGNETGQYYAAGFTPALFAAPRPRWPRWVLPSVIGLGVLSIAVLILSLMVVLQPGGEPEVVTYAASGTEVQAEQPGVTAALAATVPEAHEEAPQGVVKVESPRSAAPEVGKKKDRSRVSRLRARVKRRRVDRRRARRPVRRRRRNVRREATAKAHASEASARTDAAEDDEPWPPTPKPRRAKDDLEALIDAAIK